MGITEKTPYSAVLLEVLFVQMCVYLNPIFQLIEKWKFIKQNGKTA